MPNTLLYRAFLHLKLNKVCSLTSGSFHNYNVFSLLSCCFRHLSYECNGYDLENFRISGSRMDMVVVEHLLSLMCN